MVSISYLKANIRLLHVSRGEDNLRTVDIAQYIIVFISASYSIQTHATSSRYAVW